MAAGATLPDHLLLPEPHRLESRRARGGGGEPPTRNPRRHGQALTAQVQSAVAGRHRPAVEGLDPRLVFKVRSRTRLGDDELERRGLSLLGDTIDWQYVVVPSDEEASALRTALDLYATGPDEDGGRGPLGSFFDLVDSIEQYGVEDRRGPGIPRDLAAIEGILLVDATIWPSPDAEEALRRLGDVRRVLETLGGEEIAFDPRPQSTVIRVRADPGTLAELLELVVIERIRTPLRPLVDPSDWIRADVDDFRLSGQLAEPVGVLDDGVTTGHPFLSGLVRAVYQSPQTYSWAEPGPHGTMVAGLAAYGDFETALSERARDLPVAAPLVVGRILEPDVDAADAWVTRFPETSTPHVTIEETIRTLHRNEAVRVFCIAVADPAPFEGPHVEVLTETIDRLARELGVVVVLPTGNATTSLRGEMGDGSHALHDYPFYVTAPEHRVAEPGPAALAVTVGSVAQSDGPATPGMPDATTDIRTRAIAGRQELSPFSRVGPGVGSAVKPDVVHFGGNWAWTEQDTVSPRNPGVSTVSLNSRAVETGRMFAVGSGTSFAVPRVARLAAAIWSTYPEASANLVRALIGSSALRASEAVEGLQDIEELTALGYGLPVEHHAVASDPNRVVMFHEGSLAVDTTVVHPVPVPSDFAFGRSSRSLTVSVAFDPPVRRQRREYLAGRMRFDLLRAIDLQDVVEIYQRQPADADDRLGLPTNRRRVKNLLPGSDRLSDSTLLVRRWRADHARSMDVDDGDTYFLAVTHTRAPWAEAMLDGYETQNYALVIELHDHGRIDLDLYSLVQEQVRLPARVRVRM
ncbi:S8 family peptidase [Nitriliruptoraceae bacterium ZYF776]|nr:S8 family peptidase [Profundirhabdus halotolerans]